MAAPSPAARAPERRRTAAIAVGLLGLAISIGGAIASLAALGALQDAHQERAVARLTQDNVELIVQARLDEALGQPTLARTSTDDEDLDEELDALAGARPAARGDIDELRTSERELRDATRRTGVTDQRLLGRTISALDQVQRSAVRPFGTDVDAAEARAERTILATAVLSAAAWVGALVLRRGHSR